MEIGQPSREETILLMTLSGWVRRYMWNHITTHRHRIFSSTAADLDVFDPES